MILDEEKEKEMSIFDFKLRVSEEDKVLAAKIKRVNRTYPSLKVVGRGTVVINPSDIRSSDNFAAELKKIPKNLQITA